MNSDGQKVSDLI